MPERYESPGPPFISVEFAAALLEVPEFKLRIAIKAGLIPSYRIANRRMFVRLSEIVGVMVRSGGEGL